MSELTGSLDTLLDSLHDAASLADLLLDIDGQRALLVSVRSVHAPGIEQVAACVSRVLEQIDATTGSAAPRADDDSHGLIGTSAGLRRVRDYVAKVAATDSTVLITGETGTGKEVVAHAIHASSPRAARPFVSVNCAALPDSLLEGELFGHERGAYTGADRAARGKFEQADGGTVFIDEIGEMSGPAQVKLLRVLEDRSVERLGGQRSLPIDVRFIAATHRPIEEMVASGTFRADLFYRLNVGRIHLPPLRQRREDIPALLEHYRDEMNRRLGRAVEGFTPEAVAFLGDQDWPGNVRELRNLVEAAFIAGPLQWIDLSDLPIRPPRRAKDERSLILSVLRRMDWNVSRAAEAMRWSRMTLYRRMAKHGIARTHPPEG